MKTSNSIAINRRFSPGYMWKPPIPRGHESSFSHVNTSTFFGRHHHVSPRLHGVHGTRLALAAMPADSRRWTATSGWMLGQSWTLRGGTKICPSESWLVVWNINFIFPYIGNNHPNWLSYFSEGFKPPTSVHLNPFPMTDPYVCQWSW